jgi:hypothetical protein
MRWPAGWADPALLRLLEGAPFNCLAMEWSPALAPVAAKARAAGLSLVAIGNDAARAAGAAAGLELPPESLLLPADSVWPGVTIEARGTESGPTANPWIDSNGWLLRLAAARSPKKTVWLTFQPPGAPQIVPLDSYLRAIADTGAAGGRWVVSLDQGLSAALARGDEKARSSWKAIAGAAGFFEQHRAWNAFEPLGVVGVISDFAGPNETSSQEILNLLGRRNLAYRILETSAAAAAPLDGFQTLIAVDEGTPAPPVRRKLLEFANRGGLLVVGTAWKQPEAKPTGMDHPRLDVRTLGKGRLAICKAAPDPFMIARDVHMLLGRSFDVARFFNLAAFLSYCNAAPGGKQELVQVVSFAIRFAEDVATVWVPGKYASARLWSLGAAGPSQIEIVSENGGSSLPLPPVPVYAALELTGKAG